MKRTLILLPFLILLGLFSLAATDDGTIPRVSYVDGDVSAQAKGDSGWSVADVNLPIQEGDRFLLDRNGLLEIEVDDGSCFRANQYSEFQFMQISSRSLQIQLLSGDYIIRTTGDVDYHLMTSGGDIQLFRRGTYRVSLERDGSAELTVRDGKARITGDFGDRTVVEGRKAVLTSNGRDCVMGFARSLDGFDTWSDKRDERYVEGASRDYIPRTVNAGLNDLDSYGRWVYVVDHGYCWSPRVMVADWAPYRYGYWRYNNHWGWTWVSYDPWGWLPYHYGRWVFSDPYGWIWIPGTSWGYYDWSPCLVRFSLFGGHIGWLPLGPGEHYHGWRDRGHIEINIHNHNYYNLRAPNSVTYVSVEDFRNSRPIVGSSYGNTGVARGAAVGSAVVFRGDEQYGRNLFSRDRVVNGNLNLDPVRGSSAISVDRGRNVHLNAAPAERGSQVSNNSSLGRDASRGRIFSSLPSGSSVTIRGTSDATVSSDEVLGRGRPGVTSTSSSDPVRGRSYDGTSGRSSERSGMGRGEPSGYERTPSSEGSGRGRGGSPGIDSRTRIGRGDSGSGTESRGRSDGNTSMETRSHGEGSSSTDSRSRGGSSRETFGGWSRGNSSRDSSPTWSTGRGSASGSSGSSGTSRGDSGSSSRGGGSSTTRVSPPSSSERGHDSSHSSSSSGSSSPSRGSAPNDRKR